MALSSAATENYAILLAEKTLICEVFEHFVSFACPSVYESSGLHAPFVLKASRVLKPFASSV